MSKSSGVIHTTSVSRPQLKSYQVKDKVVPNISQVKFTKKEVEDNHRISSISKKTKSILERLEARTKQPKKSKSYYKELYENTNQEWKWWIAKRCPSSYTWTQKPLKTKKTWIPTELGKLKNQLEISGTVFILEMIILPPITGYGDLIQGNVTIKRVLLRRRPQSTIFSRLVNSVMLIWRSLDLDLLHIYHSLQETTSSTPICFMAKASPTQAWLWHRRLSHLNFDYITLLSKKDIMTGLPKLKYVKDQLCSSCQMSKAKRSSFKSKAVPSSKGRLNLLHMDLCGPMRVASINGKKYFLVIFDNYSRYTWTLFLRSKDETP
ncbi:retrovirus-related pol polyprotein from transposon TNT 1-94 [Tanacetum coccineum]